MADNRHVAALHDRELFKEVFGGPNNIGGDFSAAAVSCDCLGKRFNGFDFSNAVLYGSEFNSCFLNNTNFEGADWGNCAAPAGWGASLSFMRAPQGGATSVLTVQPQQG